MPCWAPVWITDRNLRGLVLADQVRAAPAHQPAPRARRNAALAVLWPAAGSCATTPSIDSESHGAHLRCWPDGKMSMMRSMVLDAELVWQRREHQVPGLGGG